MNETVQLLQDVVRNAISPICTILPPPEPDSQKNA